MMMMVNIIMKMITMKMRIEMMIMMMMMVTPKIGKKREDIL